MDNIKKWKRGYELLMAAFLMVGLFLIFRPRVSATGLCYLFGVLLVLLGVMRIVCYAGRGISVLWHRYELPLGVMDTLLGLYFFTRPENVLLFLPVIVGFVILADSVFKLQTAFELHTQGERHWYLLVILASISIFAGIFLIRRPFEGTVAVTVFCGISIVIDCLQGLVFLYKITKAARRAAPIEGDFEIKE